MKVRRRRYAPIGTSGDRGWREVEVYEDVTIRQVESDSSLPGRVFLLGVDSDRLDPLWVEMVGGEVDCFAGITFRGFVSRQELAHEAAWWGEDAEGCADARDRDDLDGQYVREEWYVLDQ